MEEEHQHFRKVCEECSTVVEECPCMVSRKMQITVLCADCAAKKKEAPAVGEFLPPRPVALQISLDSHQATIAAIYRVGVENAAQVTEWLRQQLIESGGDLDAVKKTARAQMMKVKEDDPLYDELRERLQRMGEVEGHADR